MIVAQAHGHRPREREHPLSVAHRRQHVVDQLAATPPPASPPAPPPGASSLVSDGGWDSTPVIGPDATVLAVTGSSLLAIE